MEQQSLEAVVRNIDRRLERVEQILPTLPTKEDVKNYVAEAIAPLATKEYVSSSIGAAIAPLATRAELAQTKQELRFEIREEGERTRRHFDVVAERLEGQFRLLAEGQIMQSERLDRRVDAVETDVALLDRRVTKLQAQGRPRAK
jgi:hypothetical protein